MTEDLAARPTVVDEDGSTVVAPTEALSDDLNTPRALPVLDELLADKKVSPADRLAALADFDAVLGLGLSTLPAFVFLRLDGTVQATAEGWNSTEWREVADAIAATTATIRPNMPLPGDPGPFHGTPALV